MEACAFRDAFPRFEGLDALVLGVSPDTARKHTNFRKKFSLPFHLIADTEHAIAEQYGVWVEKMLYGRKYWGVARTTFVIDAKGRIAHVFEKVNPEGHADEVAGVVASLSS